MYLDCAARSQDPDIALVFCHDTEVLLNNAKKAVKNANDQLLRQRVASSYIGLGKALDQQQCGPEAKAIYKKAEKMGGKVHPQIAQLSDLKSDAASVKSIMKSTVDTVPIRPEPTSSLKKQKQINITATVPSHIFVENVRPGTITAKLPAPDERLASTPLLACCLGLLNKSHELEDILEPVA
ncbi:hypothetical protein BGX34_005265, partial [Mortierella sp. NVP85]